MVSLAKYWVGLIKDNLYVKQIKFIFLEYVIVLLTPPNLSTKKHLSAKKGMSSRCVFPSKPGHFFVPVTWENWIVFLTESCAQTAINSQQHVIFSWGH